VARSTAVVDFPAPPLGEATTMVGMEGSSLVIRYLWLPDLYVDRILWEIWFACKSGKFLNPMKINIRYD
jgi:hypothetical protein